MARIGAIVLLIALLLIGGAVAAVYLIDWHTFIEKRASDAAGQRVRMDGLDIEWGWVTRIRLSGLRIDNPDWADSRPFAAVKTGTIDVRVTSLIKGPLEIPAIILEKPVLALERNSQGKVNWKPAATVGKTVSPGERREFPVIEEVVVRDGRVTYVDCVRRLALEGTIAKAKGGAGDGEAINLALDGTLQNDPLSLRFRGGSVKQLHRPKMPYPLEFDLTHGDTNVRARGILAVSEDSPDFNFDFSVSGPSLADTFPVFRIPLPPTAEFTLSGKLSRDGRLWRLTDFAGTVGDSDLSGSLSLDHGQYPPFVEASLRSQKVSLADLAGLIGADPRKLEPPRERGELFPDFPVSTPRLHAMNMDVRFDGQKVDSPNLPIESLSFRIRVTDGRALVRPLSFEIAGGKAFGEAASNAREAPPSVDLSLQVEGIGLKPFFRGSEFVQEMGGTLFGRFYVLGVGHTLDRVMATLRGDGVVAMKDGSLSGLLIEAVGLDLMEALALVVDDDGARVELRCGSVAFVARDGIVSLENTLVDTSDSLLIADGQIDLASETVDLRIEAREKDFSLIDAAAPVAITGKLIDPEFSIGGLDPLPFFELGQQDDIDCQSLIDRALKVETSIERQAD